MREVTREGTGLAGKTSRLILSSTVDMSASIGRLKFPIKYRKLIVSKFEELQAFAQTQALNPIKCQNFVQHYFKVFCDQTGWPPAYIYFRTVEDGYSPDIAKAKFIRENGFMVFEANISVDGQVAQLTRLFKVRVDQPSNMLEYIFITSFANKTSSDAGPVELQGSFDAVLEEFAAVLAYDRPSVLPGRSKDVFDLLRDEIRGK